MEHIYNTLTVPCEKPKTVSFGYSIMKNIVVFLTHARFPVKLICSIVFGSESSVCCLLTSFAIIL